MPRTLIAALYKFVALDNYKALKPLLEERCEAGGVRGTLLLASEGLNGTVAGPEEGIRDLLAYLKSDPRLADLIHKESWSDDMPFHRLKVRLKKEIVTIGLPDVDPTRVVGTYVKPKDWNEIISDPDVILVDTRNDYEVAIGTFKGAVDPKTESFRDFPEWTQNSPEMAGRKKVAMFCTGGIRCEKASSYLLDQGVEEVFHLEGGILKYLEEIPQEQSLWEGECFVFDSRVSVDHNLNPGEYDMCFGCRRPVSKEDMKSPKYMNGISCPWCFDSLSEDQKERFAERHKQIQLAAQRNEAHIGKKVVRSPRSKDAVLGTRTNHVLYSFRRCPYAIRARLALLAAEMKLELREVVLRDKPDHMLELSPKGTVPVLWMEDGTVLEESMDIILWALKQNDPLQLLPSGESQRNEMLALIETNDGHFKHHLDRYKYATRYEGAVKEEHRKAAETFILTLENRLKAQHYLFGAQRSLADLAIVPFVRQFANADREWFDAAPYPSVQNWLTRSLESEPFKRAMKKYKPWSEENPIVYFPAD